MTSAEIRQKYIEFFKDKDHKQLASAKLVLEGDPTTLFTSSGMQPMVPYLLGQTHPEGNRLVDSQVCFRAQDIEEVGDNRHDTLFEMLGNWSLGDYWKKDQLEWIFTFLTTEIGLNPDKLYVTVFSGDEQTGVSKDEESVEIWKKLFKEVNIDAQYIELGTEEDGGKKGMQNGRIFGFGVKKNWWSRSGVPQNMPKGEPGGPDSEIFYLFDEVEHDPKYGAECHPNCDCGKFLEICNSVFMQYQKQEDGSFKELPNKNVDFGGGLERFVMAANNQSDMFKNDLHSPIIEKISEYLGVSYEENQQTKLSLRIIADHIKAATFLIKDGVEPGNKLQSYVLRRLLRRAAVKLHQLKPDSLGILPKLVDSVIDVYDGTDYFQNGDWDHIRRVVGDEIKRFQQTLNKGLKEIEKTSKMDGKLAFDMYQTYGFPVELTAELYEQKGEVIDLEEFMAAFHEHQERSRTASAGMFKGGLADQSEITTKYHTTTHLLHQALRDVLGPEVFQKGSNITSERLRFDFSFDRKLTDEEVKEVEDIINKRIEEDLVVDHKIIPLEEARNMNAIGLFDDKYAKEVSVYGVGPGFQIDPNAVDQRDRGGYYSLEFCGGPHVEHTGVIGKIKVVKEEAISAGIRRIRVVLDS